MKTKVGAFIVGGCLCSLSHLMTMIYTQLGVPDCILITVTVFTLATLGALAAISGKYDGLVNIGGMGAMIPMCGFSSAIAGAVAQARSQKLSVGRVIWLGVVDGLKILGSAYLLAALLVLVMRLAA